jgi:hypothetical protein
VVLGSEIRSLPHLDRADSEIDVYGSAAGHFVLNKPLSQERQNLYLRLRCGAYVQFEDNVNSFYMSYEPT